MAVPHHRYTVEIRIYGKALEPDVITKETGLQPSRTRLIGSRLGSQIFDESMWAFNGGDDRDFSSLEDGLEFVLDGLSNVEALFAKYRAEHHVIWWCGHFQESFSGGPTLSSKVLRRLAEFGADLFIDNYFSGLSDSETSPQVSPPCSLPLALRPLPSEGWHTR